ncbi:MAG: hypothetical protein Q8O99_03390 [bacterium]|nr:hypothetical protein [bacterium]
MDRKEFLNTILSKLAPARPPAAGLHVLLQQGSLTDDTLQAVSSIFAHAIITEANEQKKRLLQKGKSLIDQLVEQEDASKLEEAKELEDLEKMIAQM